MHREAGGLWQPISTHWWRGSAVINMLILLVEAMTMGPGQGATLWCWLRRLMGGPWHITVQHIQPHGVENHLLVLIWSSQQVHLQTLLNVSDGCFSCYYSYSSLAQTQTHTKRPVFKHKLVWLISYCWAYGVVHLVLFSIKYLAVQRFSLFLLIVGTTELQLITKYSDTI